MVWELLIAENHLSDVLLWQTGAEKRLNKCPVRLAAYLRSINTKRLQGENEKSLSTKYCHIHHTKKASCVLRIVHICLVSTQRLDCKNTIECVQFHAQHSSNKPM